MYFHTRVVTGERRFCDIAVQAFETDWIGRLIIFTCLMLLDNFKSILYDLSTVKPVLSGHSKRRPKVGFQDRLSLNAGQKFCRMLHESILQYFRLSLRYHWPLRPLFRLFLSGHLRQVLLFSNLSAISVHYQV